MFGLGDKLIGMLESVLSFFWDVLVKPFTGLPTLKNWIFGKVEAELFDLNNSTIIYKTFTEKELTMLNDTLYPTTYTIAVMFFVFLVIANSMRISSAAINPSQRSALIELLRDGLLVGMLLLNLDKIYEVIFRINVMIVDMIYAAMSEENLGSLGAGLEMISNNLDGGGVLGLIMIGFILIGLAFWASFYYMMRKLTLLLFMAIGPIMVIFMMHPSTKGIAAAYAKEFLGAVFVQSVHALTFLMVTAISVTQDKVIENVILYLIFIPVSESLRALIGLGGGMDSTLSKTGAMFGMSALAGMYGAVQGARGNASVWDSIKGAGKGAKDGSDKFTGNPKEDGMDPKTLGANNGTQSGTTSVAEKMLKPGQIGSKMGKAVLGMGGSLAGAPMGPGASIIGATGGSVVGGAVGGFGGRVAGHGMNKFKSGYSDGSNKNNATAKDKLKEGLADDITSKWASQNKAGFMKHMEDKFPDASAEDREASWNNRVQSFRRNEAPSKANQMMSAMGDGKRSPQKAHANKLADKMSTDMSSAWASGNRDQFMKDYDDKHKPDNYEQLSESGKNAYMNKKLGAWNNALSAKKSQFANDAQATVQDMAQDGSPYINKNEFASKFADRASQQFGSANNGDALAVAQQSASSIKGVSAVNGKGEFNKDFIASSVAAQHTANSGKAFMKQRQAEGFTEQQASTMWQEEREQVYQGHYDSAKAKVPTDYKQANGAVRLGNGVVQGLSRATGVESVVKASQATVAGAQQAVQQVDDSGSTLVTYTEKAGAAFKGSAQGLKASVSGEGTAVEKQQRFQDSVSYASGVVLGAGGYQKARELSSKVSPYKKAVRQEIKEPSEIAGMAQTVTTEDGRQQVAPGAIRMVTTADSSHIEVRTKTGDVQKVSQSGSGHSGLKDGQVVYQDISYDNGVFQKQQIPGSNATVYQEDSGGAKVPMSTPVNVNPNLLVANRSAEPAKSYTAPMSYSQNVDQGNFYSNNIHQEGLENVQMVVQKDKSYVVAQKGSETYRVSPYGSGDSRLPAGEAKQAPVSIVNRRLVVDQGDDGYEPSVNPNDLMRSQPNPRNQRRRSTDRTRTPQSY